ncbi:MAG: endonuclease/exonuclease/phosphatase family protein [Porphyromonas sp.]|nr:endonuclease/exonuclease/phosphatase family protein [Porphyromonas sp.]
MRYILLIGPLLILLTALAMPAKPSATPVKPIDSITLMSYNVENLFDTINDPDTDDDEFTPEGSKHWSKYRYHQKLKQLARVISHVGGKHWPALICLVEVENRLVLDDLLRHTALGRQGYRYEITRSLDPRGIDVALLYLPSLLLVEERREHRVQFTQDPERRSRNLLELKLRLPNNDTLYAWAAHWPSRREGAKASEPFRRDVARLIKLHTDSIYEQLSPEERLRTHFAIMGDLNEEAHEPAIKQELGALHHLPAHDDVLSPHLSLYAMMHPDVERHNKRHAPRGSYVYQRSWSQLDHFILSQSLLVHSSHTQYISGSARNYFASFLGGKNIVAGYPAPYRTYGGPHYMGGYSDHYPIVLRLRLSY